METGEKKGKTLRSCVELVLCIALLLVLNRWFGCPIRFLTGISCAGCGMTRAYLSLLRLEPREAFYYHPLFPLPPIALAMLLWREKLPQKLFKGCMYTMAAAFLLVYVYRLCRGDGVVVAFAPRSGAVFRLISYLRGGI